MFRASRAFTLIELLTVIAIIAVLAGIVIGVGKRASESGKIARTKAELAALSTALESYKRQYGDYPRTGAAANRVIFEEDVEDVVAPDDGHGILFNALAGKRAPNVLLSVMDGRALVDFALFTLAVPNALPEMGNTTQHANAFLDPWGRRYVYYYKTNTNWSNPSYVLYSVGPDGDKASNDADCHEAPNERGYPNHNTEANFDNLYASS